MKYCFYLTFFISYSDGETAMVELTATGTRETMTNTDVEIARKETKKKVARPGVGIDGIWLIHSFKTIDE